MTTAGYGGGGGDRDRDRGWDRRDHYRDDRDRYREKDRDRDRDRDRDDRGRDSDDDDRHHRRSSTRRSGSYRDRNSRERRNPYHSGSNREDRKRRYNEDSGVREQVRNQVDNLARTVSPLLRSTTNTTTSTAPPPPTPTITSNQVQRVVTTVITGYGYLDELPSDEEDGGVDNNDNETGNPFERAFAASSNRPVSNNNRDEAEEDVPANDEEFSANRYTFILGCTPGGRNEQLGHSTTRHRDEYGRSVSSGVQGLRAMMSNVPVYSDSEYTQRMREACGLAADQFTRDGNRIVIDLDYHMWTIILSKSLTRPRRFRVTHAHLDNYQ